MRSIHRSLHHRRSKQLYIGKRSDMWCHVYLICQPSLVKTKKVVQQNLTIGTHFDRRHLIVNSNLNGRELLRWGLRIWRSLLGILGSKHIFREDSFNPNLLPELSNPGHVKGNQIVSCLYYHWLIPLPLQLTKH